MLLTTAKENVIIIISILFTPVALGFKNLEKKIELAYESDLSPEPESDDADGKEADSE